MSITRVRRVPAFGAALLAAALIAASCSSTDDSSGARETSATTSVPAKAAASASAGCSTSGSTTSTDVAASKGPVEHTVTVDGTERTYLLATSGTRSDTPAPVVVLLHGMGQTAADINRISEFPSRAADAGMIVVTPQAVGTPTIWRPGAQSPDAAFLDQVLGDLGRSHCVDLARVHIAGFSVGAVLAATYACAHQDRIASIVTVEVEMPAGCRKPQSIMAFHGTADPVIAYGNTDRSAPGGITGTEANMAAWAATGDCRAAPVASAIDSEATRVVWPDCAPGVEVVLVRIVGGGHSWPGGEDAAGSPGARTVSATDEALSFFRRTPNTRP